MISLILQKLKADLEIADAATEGPWKKCFHLQDKEKDRSCPCGFPGDIWGADGNAVVCAMGPHCFGNPELTPDRYDRETEQANAEFIAHSRTALPANTRALLRAVEALETLRRKECSGVALEALADIAEILGVGK